MTTATRIEDVDVNHSDDAFAVLPVGGEWLRIPYDHFGDYLAAAGIADGFDGERLIWFGEEIPVFDRHTGQLSYRVSRSRTQLVREYVAQDMEDADLIGYLKCASIGVTQDDLIQ